jgi:hypothetical protein
MADPVSFCAVGYFVNFFALFFAAAQRFNCPCRIFSRASALTVRFALFFAVAAAFTGRPGPRLAGVDTSINNALACWSRAICASISVTRFSIKVPPSIQFYQSVTASSCGERLASARLSHPSAAAPA